jgi:vacuolar iron transporter family protein
MLHTQEDHTPQAISSRLSERPKDYYLREWVYGGIDGVVTTFAVVAGVAGADLSSAIILIIALAGLLGDGFSMAAGCYSSTKTDEDNYKRLHNYEQQSVQHNPEGETEEIRQIFKKKGFKNPDLENIVQTITANKKLWVDTMMVEEYGLTDSHHNAWHAALHTFIAFFICGFMPVLPFIVNLDGALYISTVVSGLTFFAIGALKSQWSAKAWWWHGGETFIIGSIAACVAYGTGYALKGLLL